MAGSTQRPTATWPPHIIAAFNSHAFQGLYKSGDPWTRGGHPRLSPPNAENPSSDTLHTIEDRRDGDLIIRYERSQEVWRRNVPVPDKPGYVYTGLHPATPKRRASCRINPTDSWVLPFDLVTVEELQGFLASRQARTDFLNMVPVVKQAIALKEAEAAKERPVRDLLEATLIREGCPETDARDRVDALVHQYKVRFTVGRALNGDADHEAAAAKEIIDLYRAETKLARYKNTVLTAARTIPGVICIGATTSGSWRAYAPSDTDGEPGVFLDVHHLTNTGKITRVDRDRIIETRHRPAITAWSSPEWDTWLFGANPAHYLSRNQRATLIEQARTLTTATTAGTPFLITEERTSTDRNLIVHSIDTHTDTHIDPVWYRIGWDRTTKQHTLTAHRRWNAPNYSYWRNTYRGVTDLPFPTDKDGAPTGWGHANTSSRNGDNEHHLAWVDDTLFDLYAARRQEQQEARHREQNERRTAIARAIEYGQAFAQAYIPGIIDILTKEAHQNFLHAYGADQEPLWNKHLTTHPVQVPNDVQTALESLGRTVYTQGTTTHPAGTPLRDYLDATPNALGERLTVWANIVATPQQH